MRQLENATSRRSFLGGLLALGSLATVTKVSAFNLPNYIPVLYADGIHDDSYALQALFDGNKVYIKKDGVIAESNNSSIYIFGGHYRVDKILYIDSDLYFANATIRVTHKHKYWIYCGSRKPEESLHYNFRDIKIITNFTPNHYNNLENYTQVEVQHGIA